MKPLTDAEILTTARTLARPNGLYFAGRGGRYHVFRVNKPHRPIWVGKCRTPAELLHLIERLVACK